MSKELLTDLYQLTMNAAYLESQKDDPATFELFIRKLPKGWGYLVACGIEDAIDYATSLEFKGEDIDYLRSQNLFSESYLDWLRNFKFKGDIYAVKEGTPVAANSPILRVTARRTEAQFLETTLLNTINFQTLVASKASRIVNAAVGAKVADFGLRRAQGEDAGMEGARASYIGGFFATSNVKAGKEYRIPITGTHAHSFVTSFSTELEAFRAYCKTFPNSPTLLIDTYDIEEGVKNAVVIGKELEDCGHRLGAVRIDSGDLSEGSKIVRRILDDEGLKYVKIVGSNDLDEYRITRLLADGASFNAFGVGTRNITGYPEAALPGVYKLVEDGDGPKMKLSSGKQTLPGIKQVFRQSDRGGCYLYDRLGLASENLNGIKLLKKIIRGGKRVMPRRGLEEIKDYSLRCVSNLPNNVRELEVDQPYQLVISRALNKLTNEMISKLENFGKIEVAA